MMLPSASDNEEVSPVPASPSPTEDLFALRFAACLGMDLGMQILFFSVDGEGAAPIDPETIIGRGLTDAFPSVRETELPEQCRRVLEQRRAIAFTVADPQQDRSLSINAFPVPGGLTLFLRPHSQIPEENTDEGIPRQSGVAEEGIGIGRQIEENLYQLHLITDAAPVLIAYVDQERCFRFNNRFYSHWFGRPLEEIMHHPVEEVLGRRAYALVKEYVDAALAGGAVTFEQLMPYTGAPQRYIHGAFVPDRDENGKVRGFVSVVSDITALKQAQAEQARSLAEIEALNQRLRRAMAETHHRVKNNLQIIAAMIGMQMITVGDAVPKTELERIGLHVRTLATVHDMLTLEAKRDGEGNALSARQVLSRLLALLRETFGKHRLEYVLEDVPLSARQSASLGIVVNELVSNAMKYGKRRVQVTLERQETGMVLEVCDDGPGFPPDFVPASAAHTGLELVENLTGWDLNGKVAYENRDEGGARVIVRFPVRSDTT